MSSVLIIGIGMCGTILILATIGLVLIGLVRALKTGGLSKKEKQTHAEETQMIQDIYYGLSKMEERIETLETILIDRKNKDFHK